jgi:branched-chain amino acid transport system substrate-binding protein
MDANRRWVFKTVHNDQMMVEAIVEHMVKAVVRSVGYIGLADATGEGYLRALRPLAERAGLRLVAVETYNRADTSVTAQVLRLTTARPDAIFIASLGTPAALPQIEVINRGYTGRTYQNHGVANADFLRVAGASAEGLYLPIGPLLIASQLPDGNPAKKPSLDIIQRYEARYGAGSMNTFISNAYDAWLLFANALPRALTVARPGTPAFRVALRDAIEGTRDLAATQGVYTMSPTDHVGLDARSRQIIRVVKGQWKLADQDRP